MKRLLLILALLLLASPAWATTYYVRGDCTTGGTGTSQTCDGADGPFKTIAAMQAAVTGDQHDNSVLFYKGGTWREQFTVGAYGTAGHPFTIGAYESGANPIISGGNILTGWAAYPTNVAAYTPVAGEFTATVMPSGGDYTSLQSAETGLQNDLTAATIKTFSISAASSPTIAAGDTVLGQTSAATGVCVLVNAARTQILIKTIAIASFAAGEVVQKTADASRTVTLSDSGNSPIVGINISGTWSSADTTATAIDGWTTSATNYIHIYTSGAARHSGTYSTGFYDLRPSNLVTLTIKENFVRIDGLQLGNTSPAGLNRNIINITAQDAAGEIWISNCIMKGHGDAGQIFSGINTSTSYTGTIINFFNNIIYGFGAGANNNGFYNNTSGVTVNLSNNVLYGSKYGYNNNAGTMVAYNNIVQGATDGYMGTITGSNNVSNVASDGPTTNRITGTVTFVNTGGGTEDFHLASNDTVAMFAGTDLSGGTPAVTSDIDRQPRMATPCVGADEYYPTTIWQTALTTESKLTLFDGTKGTNVASIALVNGANKWFWASNIIYVYSATNPTTAFTTPGIETGVRNYGISISQSYVTVDGLTVTLPRNSGIYIGGAANADANIIQNCTITYAPNFGWKSGIIVNHGGNNLITRNTVTDCYQGIILSSYHATESYDTDSNTISHNTVARIDSSGIGIVTGLATAYQLINNIVEYNDVSLCSQTFDDTAGILTSRAGAGNIIRYNRTYTNGLHPTTMRGSGIMIDENSNGEQVYYNLSYGNTSSGIGTSGDSTLIYNNVMYNNAQGIFLFLSGLTSNSSANSLIKNNIVVANGDQGYALVRAEAVAAGGNVFDYNVYYGSSKASPFSWDTGGPPAYDHTWAQWQVHNPEAHSVVADPLFVSTSNFHLQPTSPARRAGVNVGLTTDYDGRAVKPTPDIGAYQYPGGGGAYWLWFLRRNK